jgi:hypothetical protein
MRRLTNTPVTEMNEMATRTNKIVFPPIGVRQKSPEAEPAPLPDGAFLENPINLSIFAVFLAIFYGKRI